MDRRTEKGEGTKALIIESAIKIIAQEGIGALSAAKLAQKAGISKGNLFHHFKSTEAILLALAERVMSASRLMLLAEGESVETYLNAMAGGILDMAEEDQLMFRAYFAVYNHGLFNQTFNTCISAQTDQLLKQLSGQMRRKHEKMRGSTDIQRVSEEIYRACSAHFLAFIDGLGLQVLLGQSRDIQIYRHMIDMEVKWILRELSQEAGEARL